MDLAWELRGYSLSDLQLTPRMPRSIGRTRAFGRPVYVFQELEDALLLYVSRAAEKVRRFRLAASSLCVYLSTNPWRSGEAAYSNAAMSSLTAPTNGTPALVQVARSILKKIFRPGYAYHRVGIQLLDLVPERPTQQSWLPKERDEEKQRRMMQVLDELVDRFGRAIIFYGHTGLVHSWQKQAGYPTGRFTTCWQEVALVYAR